jgi:peptide/nickel transport system substrate-binding protein
MSAKPYIRAIALAAAASLLSPACTGGGTTVVTPTAPAPTITNSPSSSPTPTASTPPVGGNVTFGAEGWPECLNPITSCADNAWAYYAVLEHVLPRAMQLNPKGTDFVPSPLLVEAPSLINGDLSENPFTVTFKIRPEAVWEDGSPITSADFDFTWRAILGTPGAIRTAGYEQIESIETTDPSTAVIRFKSVYADWPDLFGGAFGFILKQAAFAGQVGLFSSFKFAMLESIPFSGGPFLLASWSKERAVLVRNARYFGPRANVDSVTFISFEKQPDLMVQDLLTGEISAAGGDGTEFNVLFQFSGNPALKAIGSRGTDFEAMWFNLASPPMDDTAVRQALMYAIDRQAIIDELIRQEDPDAKVLNCGFVAIPAGPWCQTTPFAKYVYDPTQAKAILKADGYDCSSTPCTKNGKPLEVGYDTIRTSPLRTATRALLIPKALEAGFELKASTPSLPPAVSDLPARTAPDPSITNLFACHAIPTALNGEAGQNFSH